MAKKTNDELEKHYSKVIIEMLAEVTSHTVTDFKYKNRSSEIQKFVIARANKYGRDDKELNAKWLHESCSDASFGHAIGIIKGLKIDFKELEKAFVSLSNLPNVGELSQLIQFLVFKGVDPNIENHKLMVSALIRQEHKTIKTLLDVGAEIHTQSIYEQIEPYVRDPENSRFFGDYGLLKKDR